MNQKDAWWEIGCAFSHPYEKRGKLQKRMTGEVFYNATGICGAIAELFDSCLISYDTSDKMADVIYDIRDSKTYTGREYFDNPNIRANQIARADFCFLMYYSLGGK